VLGSIFGADEFDVAALLDTDTGKTSKDKSEKSKKSSAADDAAAPAIAAADQWAAEGEWAAEGADQWGDGLLHCDYCEDFTASLPYLSESDACLYVDSADGKVQCTPTPFAVLMHSYTIRCTNDCAPYAVLMHS
jgi:hypothetical protein